MRKWTQNQFRDITTQLELGARVLDFRPIVDYLNKEWKIGHSIFAGAKLIDLFEQIRDFLLKNSSEFVILMLRNIHLDDQPKAIQSLLKILSDTFGDLIYEQENDIGERTVGELVDRNKQILISIELESEEVEQSSLVWANNKSRFIYNTYADRDDYAEMTSFNRQMIGYFKTGVKPDILVEKKGDAYTKKNLFILSWTQTCSTGAIVNSIKPGDRKSSIYDYSQTALHQFGSFDSEMNAKWEYPVVGNIFLMDFLDEATADSIVKPLVSF